MQLNIASSFKDIYILMIYLGWTALHASASKAKTEVAKVLVELGADIHAKGNEGQYS